MYRHRQLLRDKLRSFSKWYLKKRRNETKTLKRIIFKCGILLLLKSHAIFIFFLSLKKKPIPLPSSPKMKETFFKTKSHDFSVELRRYGTVDSWEFGGSFWANFEQLTRSDGLAPSCIFEGQNEFGVILGSTSHLLKKI